MFVLPSYCKMSRNKNAIILANSKIFGEAMRKMLEENKMIADYVLINELENRKNILRVVIIITIILFVIPRWLITVNANFKEEYLSGFHGVKNNEYASYAYLEQNTLKDDIVMVVSHPEREGLVSVAKMLSGSNLYLSGEGARQTASAEILRRRSIVESIKNADSESDFDILIHEKIKYLYYYGKAPESLTTYKGFKVVFQNRAATIIRIDL